MTDEQKGQKVVVEMQGVDKRVMHAVWQKMKAGEELEGQEQVIGQSMADHPEWYPIFDTMDVLGGDDVLPDGTNPFAHITFHVLVGSQIYNRNPPEAQTFYVIRTRKGDHRHDVIHMMVNVFQRHLAWTAQNKEQTGGQFDMKAYSKTLKSLWPLKSNKIWARLGYKKAPKHTAG